VNIPVESSRFPRGVYTTSLLFLITVHLFSWTVPSYRFERQTGYQFYSASILIIYEGCPTEASGASGGEECHCGSSTLRMLYMAKALTRTSLKRSMLSQMHSPRCWIVNDGSMTSLSFFPMLFSLSMYNTLPLKK